MDKNSKAPKPKLLVADDIHVNERNFNGLREILFHNFDVVFDRYYDKGLKQRSGNYDNEVIGAVARHYLDWFTNTPPQELKELSIYNCKLWEIAEAELLSFVIPTDRFYESCTNSPDFDVFEFCYENFRVELIYNLAAAAHWVDYWYKKLKELRPAFVVVFSGSLIYAKALLYMTRFFETVPLVVESSFIGKLQYIERRYGPIPNNTQFGSPNLLRTCIEKYDQAETQAKFFELYWNRTNKNVKQPPKKNIKAVRRDFGLDNRTPVVLVIGQVANDFSVMQSGSKNINTVRFYEETIDGLLKNHPAARVIVKTHPWERAKSNIQGEYTYSRLFEHILLDKTWFERVTVIGDYNIESLFEIADVAVTLESQAGIEAALKGVPVVQAGHAFYGGFGFTEDCETASEAVDAVLRVMREQEREGKNGRQYAKRYQDALTFTMNFAVNHLFVDDDIDIERLSKVMGYELQSPNETEYGIGQVQQIGLLTLAMRRLQHRIKKSRFIGDHTYRYVNALGKLVHGVLVDRTLPAKQDLKHLLEYTRDEVPIERWGEFKRLKKT